jgi:uncharacterized protein (TIGR03067 family)
LEVIVAINLTGTWHAVYGELNGEMTPAAHFSGIEITYKENRFQIHVHGVLEHEGEFSINEKTSPAQITYVYTKSSFFVLNKPRVGIVQIVGSTLKDCLGAVGAHPPANFNTEAKSDTVLTIHQKHGQEGGVRSAHVIPKLLAMW